MPDETPTPTPETPQPEPETGPTKEELQARTQQAEAAAAAAREQAAYATGVAQAAASQSNRPPAPRGPDPLDDYFKNELVLSPEEKRARLQAAINGPAQRARNDARREMQETLAQERMAIQNDIAFQTTMSMRPDLQDPRASGNFAAAMTKAKFEADSRGVNLTAGQLMTEAVRQYDAIFKPPVAPKVPYVEGQSRPDMGGTPQGQQAAPQRSDLERIYKMKAGLIQPPPTSVDGELDWGIATDKYIGDKNKKWLNKGVNTQMNEVLVSVQEGEK
jgi:hypothetical protein